MALDCTGVVTAAIAAAAALIGATIGLAGGCQATKMQLDHDTTFRLRDKRKAACVDALRSLTKVMEALDDGLDTREEAAIRDAQSRALDMDRPLIDAVSTLVLVAPDRIVQAVVDRNVVSDAVLASNTLTRLASSTDDAQERETAQKLRERIREDYSTLGDLCRDELRPES